jgi:hypothetical protein
VTILTFVVVAFLSYKAFMRLSLADMCGVDVVNERYSENKKVKAVLYQFDCGAMDSFSTQVSVLDASENLLNTGGNVFSAKHSAYRGEWGGPYAEIKWLNNSELLISYAEDAEILQMQKKSGAAHISYKKIPVNIDEKEKSVFETFMSEEGFVPSEAE